MAETRAQRSRAKIVGTNDREEANGGEERKCQLIPGLSNLKVLLGVSTLIHSVCMVWTCLLPPDQQLIPAAAIVVHVPSMIIMAFTHSVHHIGVKQSLAFFVVVVVIEWSWEQVNVWSNGLIFGMLQYHDTLIGPKLIDIPFIVPLAFAALCWPAFVITNILLHNHPVKVAAKEPFIALVWRCAIFAFIHTAWSPCVEPVVVKHGAFGYPTVGHGGGAWEQGTFFSIPLSEFRGWWLMAFTACLVYTLLVAPRLAMPPPKPVDALVDATPLILFGGFALWLIVKPIDPVAGMFALFTMGLSILQCMYKILFVVSSEPAAKKIL